MEEDIIKQKKNTLSISLELLSLYEMLCLLSQYDGYIDGDSRTLELYVITKERREVNK